MAKYWHRYSDDWNDFKQDVSNRWNGTEGIIGKAFAEAYPGIKDEYAVLNEKQIELLHYYLRDVYDSYGLNLDYILAGKGEIFDGKELTPFESKELVCLADEAIALSATIIKRKERLYKK